MSDDEDDNEIVEDIEQNEQVESEIDEVYISQGEDNVESEDEDKKSDDDTESDEEIEPVIIPINKKLTHPVIAESQKIKYYIPITGEDRQLPPYLEESEMPKVIGAIADIMNKETIPGLKIPSNITNIMDRADYVLRSKQSLIIIHRYIPNTDTYEVWHTNELTPLT